MHGVVAVTASGTGSHRADTPAAAAAPAAAANRSVAVSATTETPLRLGRQRTAGHGDSSRSGGGLCYARWLEAGHLVNNVRKRRDGGQRRQHRVRQVHVERLDEAAGAHARHALPQNRGAQPQR